MAEGPTNVRTDRLSSSVMDADPNRVFYNCVLQIWIVYVCIILHLNGSFCFELIRSTDCSILHDRLGLMSKSDKDFRTHCI